MPPTGIVPMRRAYTCGAPCGVRAPKRELCHTSNEISNTVVERSESFSLIMCHEHPLKRHEQVLIEADRRGTGFGGWPHVDVGQRKIRDSCIATVTALAAA